MIIGVILCLGISYALFSEVLTGEKSFVLESNGLKIYLDETNTLKDILIENAIPTLDRDGVLTESYKFSLVNEEKQDLDYVIYLKEDEYPNKTPSSVIRYRYTRDVDSIDVIRSVPDNQTEDGRYFLEKDTISGGKTYNYTLQMWIDYNAGNEILNTKYSAHIEIEAIQTSGNYKEAVLRGTDPVLTENLIPVKIGDSGTVRRASLYEEWYKYEDKKWANAVVLKDKTKTYKEGQIIPEEEIESYFVWIPRYKYKIFNTGNYVGVTEIEETAVQTIEVVFEDKNTPVSDGTEKGEWLSHPAFQAFDSNGFWVGKFESGYDSATTTEEAQVNSSDVSKLIIKPDVYSWRGITVGNMFKLGYDYLREDESHTMKNTEWGAVAYLQHSAYGSQASVRFHNNRSFLTGFSSTTEPTLGNNNQISIPENPNGTTLDITVPYNTKIGYTASTTGNITGIYDMSGGAWEFVVGYNMASNTIETQSEIVNIYNDFFTNLNWKKYYDQYFNETTDDANYQAGLLGDATKEMGPFQSIKNPDGSVANKSSWYGDYSNVVNINRAWFRRGGHWDNGSLSGIFGFVNINEAYPYISTSFRVVLTPQ